MLTAVTSVRTDQRTADIVKIHKYILKKNILHLAYS